MNAYLIIQAITFRIHVVVVDGSGAIRNFKLQFEYAFIVLFLLFTVCRYFPFSFRSLFFLTYLSFIPYISLNIHMADVFYVNILLTDFIRPFLPN